MHGLFMEVDLFGEIFISHTCEHMAGRREMVLVGAFPFPQMELKAECFFVGRQVIAFVEACKYIGICHGRNKLWQADFAVRCAKAQRPSQVACTVALHLCCCALCSSVLALLRLNVMLSREIGDT